MAGFFGFMDVTKPGKGVNKDGPEKNHFFNFFDMYLPKFFKLTQLNMLYVLFCLPIITIGPATVALAKICHKYSMGMPVFLFSDFKDEFKKNFKQGFLLGLVNLFITVCLIASYILYTNYIHFGFYMYIFLGIAIIFAVLFVFTTFYSYLLCGLVNISILDILKDSVLLAIAGSVSNFCSLFFSLLVLWPVLYFYPLSAPIFIFFPLSTVMFIVVYNSFRKIYKFIIKPYYEMSGEKDPYAPEEPVDEDEIVFEDAVELEKSAKDRIGSSSSSNGTNKIS